ncbi:MAG: cobalamin B12-binding domain-containing protein [Nitrospinae bacterium]|nr:cobalamin B12-binding domain-containing protein [Nitrospinota bacterium]
MTERKIKNILLMFPGCTIFEGKETKRATPPMGLAYLAGVLREKYNVKIIDVIVEGFENEEKIEEGRMRYGMSYEGIKRAVSDFSPDVIGISALFSSQSEEAYLICRAVKEVDKEIIVVMGGAHATVMPYDVLKRPYVDYIILGEGEKSFPELLGRIEKGNDITNIDGLGYRINGDIKINPKTGYIKNLDELPFPARELLNVKKYTHINSPHGKQIDISRLPFTPVVTSRGCPASCTTCYVSSIWGKRNYRFRSAENVLKEFELIAEKGYKEFYFDDDNFSFNRERAMKIFNGMIERKFDFTWSTPNGTFVNSLDDEMLTKMRQSGCYHITFAIESGNQEILTKVMKKPINLKRLPRLVKKTKELGMRSMGFFMIGFPGETKEQVQNTVNYAKELVSIGLDYATFYIVTPLPGTELYKMCKEKGYINEDADMTKYMFARGVIRTGEFTPEYLERMRFEAWRTVNF